MPSKPVEIDWSKLQPSGIVKKKCHYTAACSVCGETMEGKEIRWLYLIEGKRGITTGTAKRWLAHSDCVPKNVRDEWDREYESRKKPKLLIDYFAQKK